MPPDKWLKLTRHSSPLSTVVRLGDETKRFQPAGHRAGSLAANRWAACRRRFPSIYYSSLNWNWNPNMSQEIRKAIIELKRDEIASLVNARLEKGEDPLQILDECREGMNAVGDLYQEGDYFLAELVLSAEVFKAAVAILEPHLARVRPAEPLGKVLVATLKGDMHDLGKNIFATMLKAQGFEIVDMGVDVPPELVLEKVKETRPDFVGFSALISTAFDSMKAAVDMLEANGLRDRLTIMVGGGVTNSTVKDYVGADFQSVDATEGVRYCMKMMEGERR